jgi:hypothetical protein
MICLIRHIFMKRTGFLVFDEKIIYLSKSIAFTSDKKLPYDDTGSTIDGNYRVRS